MYGIRLSGETMYIMFEVRKRLSERNLFGDEQEGIPVFESHCVP